MITASLTGIVVGIVVGMLGAGGGILAVPILVYALGQSPHSATAESLVIVGLTALVAMATRWRAVHLREGFIFGFGAIVGAAIGSRLSPLVDGRILLLLFSTFLFCVGTAIAIKALPGREVEKTSPRTRKPLVAVIFTALGTGILTGFFGVGGGFVVVPALILVLGIPIRFASATSLLVMVLTATCGLLARIGTDVSIDWKVTLAFGLASMLGGLIGGPLSKKLPAKALTAAFAGLLLSVAVFIAVMNMGS
ncbi:sulfite exporter TauE/SafE family protein [Trueperella pyogenes]|uniref:Probable membrane transporter protein n=1 Tax=Trueperella pyogenes TaxID=1661 RepID=A0A3S9QN66_9ACTO|nr:sulfite exporter TauE/SafE family protein [Trueperella pyogenes]AZR07389.1 sulfite exporter TauE/SafE family protein [Trueperella pyogenes]